jgi:hypothetical protein
MLSVHAGPHANHRVEVRRLLMQTDMELEELLKNGWNDGQGANTATKLIEATGANATGAKRAEDRGFYGARVPYYRAVLGTLQRISAKQGLKPHPAPSSPSLEVSRLAYQTL